MGLGRCTEQSADVPGDLPRQDHPLPKGLDDAAAARLLRAAQADNRLLVRVTVEVLLRTGLRVSEFTGLRSDAVVQIGPWLHVPVGKLREDRYLPLYPQLVGLIDDYRATHVPAEHPLLLPRENGRALDRHRHPIPQQGRRGSRSAAQPPPTSCGTPWPPKPSTAACRSRRSPRCSGTAAWT
jgi:integrase